VAEAGLPANRRQERFASDAVLSKVAELCLALQKVPTYSEMRMRRQVDPAFPNEKTVAKHFGSMGQLVKVLRDLSREPAFNELARILPPVSEPVAATKASSDGFVYLLKSGEHYKIGRSQNLERRVREISIALPESTSIEHAIRTDDPAGIEAYWHRRFADRRANGEWFRLSRHDVRAFRRRTFQ